MRIFVTGASGFIGSAVVKELIKAGHTVLGLARSDASAAAVAANGAEVLRGTIEDLEILKSGAASTDGTIHLAFIHDWANFAASCEKDKVAIEAMCAALEGTGKPFVSTSGAGGLPQGRLVTESEAPDETSLRLPRMSESAALAYSAKGVRVSVIRLSPTVHGAGDHAFVPMLIDIARKSHESAYVGTGANRWPAIHRDDAAVLYRLAVEKAPTGSLLHGVSEQGVKIIDVATLIGKHLKVPVVSKTKEEAGAHFGFLAMFIGGDMFVSSAATQALLGWHPTHPELLADMEAHYFTA